MLFARRSPIAVDLGTHAVRLLQLTQRRGEVLVQDAILVEIEPGARDAEERLRRVRHAAQRALQRGEFRGRDAIGAIPLERTTTRSLRVARHEAEDLESTLTREAAELFGEEAESYAAQWMHVGERIERGEHRTEILCCFAPQVAIQETLGCFAELGLSATALDLDACAMARPFARRAESMAALLEIGAQTSRVCLTRGGDPMLVRVLPSGGAAMLERLRERLHIDRRALEEIAGAARPDEEKLADLEAAVRAALEGPLEPLAAGVLECLRYAATCGSGRAVEALHLVGGVAEIPGLVGVLRERVGVPVEIGDPFRSSGLSGEMPAALRRGRAGFAVALGLALRGLAA